MNERAEDLTSFEDKNKIITIYMQKDDNDNFFFVKHIINKVDLTESLTEYTLRAFFEEFYLIEKFIKSNLVKDRELFKQLMKLKY